jgi:hypothetical protein
MRSRGEREKRGEGKINTCRGERRKRIYMKREIIIKWNFMGRGNLTWQVLEEPKNFLSALSFNLDYRL